MRKISDSPRLSLLEESEKLGIFNIDVADDQLSTEIIQIAIEATKQLDTRLDKEFIAQKLRETDSVIAAPCR
jgi:hypothetical protein